jgi:hypothetical protein
MIVKLETTKGLAASAAARFGAPDRLRKHRMERRRRTKK